MQQEDEDHSIFEDDSLDEDPNILEEDSLDEEGDDQDEFMDEDDSSSLSVPNISIDFDLVYSLHTFVATVDGQANVVKGDHLFLMDDSNSHWWLVRVLRTKEVGYIPAENIQTPYERLARFNKHRNVILAAASAEERTLDPIAYRLHHAHLVSQQHHLSHPSHPSNVRKRSVSFRGSSTYHYPPAVWDEDEELGWEEQDYDGYDTGVDQPLNDEEDYWDVNSEDDWEEIRAQRQQQYKYRDAWTLHHTLHKEASNSTLQQQTSNEFLRQQDYKPPLRRQGSREAFSPSTLRLNSPPESVLSARGGSSTASDNVASAPKVFDLAVLGGNETRKISATPPLASEGVDGVGVLGMNNGKLTVPLPSAILAQQENERKSARYGDRSYRDWQWKPVEGGTTNGVSTLSKTSEREAQSAQKPEKPEEGKSWKKGSIFRGLFGGKKEKESTGNKGTADAVNGKRSQEYHEPVGLVTTNEEGGPGGRLKTGYSTGPPEEGQSVGSTDSYGKQGQGMRVRRLARKPPPAYQETAPKSTAPQPSYGLQKESGFPRSFILRSGIHERPLAMGGTTRENPFGDGMSGPASTSQPVERGLAQSLNGTSPGTTSAMVSEAVFAGIGRSDIGTGHQHLVDRSDLEKLKVSLKSVAEGHVHDEPLPPLIDATPRAEGGGPRQSKHGSKVGTAAPPVLAISGPGDDAEVDKVYHWNNGASEYQEEKPGSTLETLMQTRIPLDLTGQVVIPDYRRPAHEGLAVVYPGLWNDRPVAVKLLKFQKDGGADAYWDVSNERRVRREISVWAALKHPNITEFLGYSTDLADFPAMISRWCERGTVLEHLKRQALSINQRMKLAQDVSCGLEYLHKLKVVHGDVKPANILVDDEGLAKLCDFGLARLVDWDGPAGMTTTSPYTGTERYKAPELFVTAENRRPVATFAGDTYSLGCIILEFIERIYPFQRFTKTYELRDAIMDGYAPALRSETTHALMHQTDSFWSLLEACWAERPGRPSVTVIVDVLDYFARVMSGFT